MTNPISKVVAYTLNKGASLKPYQKLEGKIDRKTLMTLLLIQLSHLLQQKMQ